MQAPGPTIETARLILRPTARDDLDGFFDLLGDEEAARFIGGTQARSGAWRQLCTMAGAWTLYGFGMFSVIEKASGRCIGRLGPWSPEGWPGTEVGWGLARSSWGQGYATEGAIAAVDWAFDHLGWAEVIHVIDPNNSPSAKVAQRLGSRVLRSGKLLPAPFNDIHVDVWGQSREEWKLRRKAG
jgi:RimJ/RimL family protein N-acetyltransferase